MWMKCRLIALRQGYFHGFKKLLLYINDDILNFFEISWRSSIPRVCKIETLNTKDMQILNMAHSFWKILKRKRYLDAVNSGNRGIVLKCCYPYFICSTRLKRHKVTAEKKHLKSTKTRNIIQR